MKYNYLGDSGLKVSNICLGTMTFGEIENGPVQCTEAESHALLDKFVAAGGNFIDTADIYQKGKSEAILGTWLCKQQRDKFVIATKLWHPLDGNYETNAGLSRNRIIKCVNESLKRLQTDYIDLYQIHTWDDATPLEETLGALNDLVTAGKVRYIGGSNLTGWQLQRIMDMNRERGWSKWVSLQQQWNLLTRETEFEVTDVCRRQGVGVLPWSPLKGGWLSGKIKRDVPLEEGSRVAFASAGEGRKNQSRPDYDQFANKESTWQLLDAMAEMGKAHGRSVAQVALRWLLQQDIVPAVVIGAKTVKQLDDNMAAADWELTEEEMTKLSTLSKPDIPYPYEMIWRLNKGRIRNFKQ